MRSKIVFISGATATGKTGLSIEIAKKFRDYKFEVVNFDSLLFYKELNIGTAKPTDEEMNEIPHHLVNICSAKKELNANQYIMLALDKIEELHKKNAIPILVGGSTFYLRSLVKGMYDSPTVSEEIKEECEKVYKEQGISAVIKYLKEFDPKSLDNLHENDHYRLMRAYEHHRMTKTPISKQKEKADNELPYDFSKNIHPNWDILHINLDLEKEKHWSIIKARAEKMINEGLIQEVQALLDTGFTGNEKPLQSIGYKETISYLQGDIPSQEELVERIYIATRRLAKSQKTFLKKVTPKNTYDPTDKNSRVLLDVQDFLQKS